MGIERAINYDDLRRRARLRLPKIAYDFIEGGVDDELGAARNQEAFRRVGIVPRYGVDVTRCDQSTVLFGRRYASPFGIAPTGAAALFWPGADLALARTAKAADIPFIMSGAATASIEDLARTAPEQAWYQLYPTRSQHISDDIVRRAADAGFSTLAVTVDVPMKVKRERNIRNGFARPLKPSWAARLEALLHPAWMLRYLRDGQPPVSNFVPYAPVGAGAEEINDFFSSESPVPVTWAELERLRRMWPRRFVIKGLMHPEDTQRAVSIGADGIIVSNHGGRQLDRSPAPIEVLPALCDLVGDRITLMLDSGIRRGSDIIVALCLGARFVFVGRWTLYGVAAAGEAGARHAVAMIRDEVQTIMAQMGAPDVASLGSEFLMRGRDEDRRKG